MVQVADAREKHKREAEAAVHEQELERQQLAEEERQAAAAKASFPVCCSVLSSACAPVVAQAIKPSCLAETCTVHHSAAESAWKRYAAQKWYVTKPTGQVFGSAM